MSDERQQKIKFSNNLSFISLSGRNVTVTEGGADKSSAQPGESAGEKEAAWNAGYNQGVADCEAELRPKLEALTAELNSVASGIPAALSEYFTELERQTRNEAGELAFKIAEIIMKRLINRRPNIKELIDEVLAPVTSPRGSRLHLNPKVADRAVGGGDITLPADVEICPDPNLAEGEAFLETSQGIIDGTLEGRMSILREKFNKFMDDLEKNDNF